MPFSRSSKANYDMRDDYHMFIKLYRQVAGDLNDYFSTNHNLKLILG
ncbi:hypothetical protein AYI68_g8274, partial [Smittium mucronatum]